MTEGSSTKINARGIYDAHNHLQDARLVGHSGEILRQLEEAGVVNAVVNGTRESDWGEVVELCGKDKRLLPSIGLHPWYVKERSETWKRNLERQLNVRKCGIGEIGLDRWMKDYDWEPQQEVFLWQLSLAAERNLPVSIHCLEAWGKMLEALESNPLPKCGFLLHSYGGPAEMVPAFVKLGAYFSFSGYFAHERKARQRDVFRNIPLTNILIETDAPDMLPPPQLQVYPLESGEGDRAPNPANIGAIYEYFGKTFDVPLDRLREQLKANFERLFGPLLG